MGHVKSEIAVKIEFGEESEDYNLGATFCCLAFTALNL